MSNLGNDLIFAEILPKLPAKSLMRFKCVSKSFETHISSRDFAKLHLRHHSLPSSGNDLLVLPGENNLSCYELDSTATTIKFTWNCPFATVVGSCNGLLCIFVQNWVKIDMRISVTSYFSVINPVTRTCLDVPSFFRGRGSTNIGFAFDLFNLDFKIVVVADQHRDDEMKNETRSTMVYSLNTNSWTLIESKLPEDVMPVITYGGILINNSLLHWIFRKGRSLREYRIGCFDVCQNKWVDDVLVPQCYDPTQEYCIRDIGVLDDHLYSTIANGVEHCFDVWLMKEYGVQDSWFKLLSIPVSSDIRYGVMPVACRGGSAEVLIREYVPSTRLFWYNRNNGGYSEAKFNGAPNFTLLQLYMCSRSLVELPGGRLFEDPHKYPFEIVNGKIVYDLLEDSNSECL